MASADAFVFPSDADSAGNGVLEAQACGVPVLVSSRGGARENVRDRETGFVCRAGDARDFSSRLQQLLVDRQLRTSMGAHAREYAAGRSWQASLEVLFNAYRAAALAPAGAGPTGVHPVPVEGMRPHPIARA